MRLKSKWIILFGILAVACGLGLFIFTQISVNNAEKQSAKILSQIEKILPQKTNGITDVLSYMQMPAVEIDGEDIIGVIEFKELNVSLPLGNKWDENESISYPKRFSGTVYDNSLVIGGYYCKGQFDCLTRLDNGNIITVTDMTGAQFSYEIKDIIRKKDVDSKFLSNNSFDITLFVYSPKSFDYIIVRGSNVFN